MARHLFIVSRSHRELYHYLLERFADDQNVAIILDRRIAERRQRVIPVATDRRMRDRRSRPGVDVELRSRSHVIVELPDLE